MFAAKIVFSAAVIFGVAISDKANADHVGLWGAPACEDVWNPASPPKAASQTVIGTVQYLDSVGFFSGGNGAVLGGTTPYSVFLQIAIASSLGALDPSTQTPQQQQCQGIFQIGQTLDPSSNAFGPILESDMAEGTWVHGYFGSFAEYLSSLEFFERRLCPCYNMMPRELFENLNCKAAPGHFKSLSESYMHCQSVDFTPYFAAGGPYEKPLAVEMDLGRDATKVEGWQGCIRPDAAPLGFFEDYGRSGLTRNAAHSLAVSTFNLKASVAATDWNESPFDWLDRTAGSCMPCTSDVEEKAIFAAYSPTNPGLTRAFVHEGCSRNIWHTDGSCKGCGPTTWSTPKQGCCRSGSKRSKNPPLKLVTSVAAEAAKLHLKKYPTPAERNAKADTECKSQCEDSIYNRGLECTGYESTKLRRTQHERRRKQPALRYGCELHFEPIQEVGVRSKSKACRRATCSVLVDYVIYAEGHHEGDSPSTDFDCSVCVSPKAMECATDCAPCGQDPTGKTASGKACMTCTECALFLPCDQCGDEGALETLHLMQTYCKTTFEACDKNAKCKDFVMEAVGRDEPPTLEEAATVGQDAAALLECYMANE